MSLSRNRSDISPEFASVNVNSRRILSAEDIPQSLSWHTQKEALEDSQKEASEDFENPNPEKETGFYQDRDAEFTWSVPQSSSSKKRNRYSSIKGFWDSARLFLNSGKAWLTTHSTVEVKPVDVEFKCSNVQTFMNLIKGSTGTGILTLPLAFMNAGLWAGFFGFLLVSLVAIHCMHIMVRSAVQLERRSHVHIQSYPQVLRQSLTYGPKKLRWMGPAFEMFGHAIIYIMQCSFCCVFIVWMAVNVKNVLDQVWAGSPEVRVYEIVIFLLLLPYVMISDLRTLSVFSALANALYIISLVIVCQFLFQDLPDASKRPAFKSWQNMPLFLGAAIYCFECVCLVIPLRGRMRREEDMGGWTGLLTLTETVVVAADTAIGFYGYLKFGESTAPAITLNLPQGEWLYHSVTLMFAASVFFSLAVQFYVPVVVLWPAVDNWLSNYWTQGYNKIFAECLTRACLLTFILLFAVLVPHIDLLVELIGSLFGCLISMIVPALVEIIIMSGEAGEFNTWTLLKDFIIIIVGVAGLLSGTYVSMLDIIETF